MGEPRRRVSGWLQLLIFVGAFSLLTVLSFYLFIADHHVRVVNASGRDLSEVTIVFRPVRSAATRVERAIFGAGDSVDFRMRDADCRVELQWLEGEAVRAAASGVDPLFPGERWKIEIRPDGTLHVETE